ncbi:MAG: type I-U CRISPR-associated RAMP protein Csb1/Cas7u [Thermoplasmata archaeon]
MEKNVSLERNEPKASEEENEKKNGNSATAEIKDIYEIIPKWRETDGPACLIIKAWMEPVDEIARFQPAGFPEVGHVIYDAPRKNGVEKVCIVDSPASMANHLESVCLADLEGIELHPDLKGMPYLVCTTDRNYNVDNDGNIEANQNDPQDKVVVISLKEGHRIASDYFLDGKKKNSEKTFREELKDEFKIKSINNKTYFLHPEDWWNVIKTIFKYDPNSLIHGVLFPKMQIKISRILTGHLEAIGASRVSRSGVKFDRLRKTVSRQPIFAVDEETAREIIATFTIDLAMLRSFGKMDADNKDENDKKESTEPNAVYGLSEEQKKFLLELALWKIKRILEKPYRFRTQCYLKTVKIEIKDECGKILKENADINSLVKIDIQKYIKKCFGNNENKTIIYYPVNDLFKHGKKETATGENSDIESNSANESEKEEEEEDSGEE